MVKNSDKIVINVIFWLWFPLHWTENFIFSPNSSLKSGVADIRHLLDRQLKVGLGTGKLHAFWDNDVY